MKQFFPISIGSNTYASEEALKEVQLGITTRGRRVTLFTLFNKWKKSDLSLSFQVFVEQWCSDNHTELPLSVNDVTPPRVQTFDEAINEALNAPAYEPVEPQTALQLVVSRVVQQASEGSLKAADLLGKWCSVGTQKVNVDSNIDLSGDITIDIL